MRTLFDKVVLTLAWITLAVIVGVVVATEMLQ